MVPTLSLFIQHDDQLTARQPLNFEVREGKSQLHHVRFARLSLVLFLRDASCTHVDWNDASGQHWYQYTDRL